MNLLIFIENHINQSRGIITVKQLNKNVFKQMIKAIPLHHIKINCMYFAFQVHNAPIFDIEEHAALDRSPGPGYDTLLLLIMHIPIDTSTQRPAFYTAVEPLLRGHPLWKGHLTM